MSKIIPPCIRSGHDISCKYYFFHHTAIYGYNFCSGARRAFKMLTSNVMRVAAINSVGTFVLFLAKVAVVTATVFIGMAIMRGKVRKLYISFYILYHPWYHLFNTTVVLDFAKIAYYNF